MIRNIRHTGFVVRDLERSLVFYSALGLQIWQRKLETGPYIDTVVGIPCVCLEWAKLRTSDGVMIELLQYHSHPEQKANVRALVNQVGCSHVAFTVNNIKNIIDLILSLGGTVINPPAISCDSKFLVSYCYDPDGILIELVEELSINV